MNMQNTFEMQRNAQSPNSQEELHIKQRDLGTGSLLKSAIRPQKVGREGALSFLSYLNQEPRIPVPAGHRNM